VTNSQFPIPLFMRIPQIIGLSLICLLAVIIGYSGFTMPLLAWQFAPAETVSLISSADQVSALFLLITVLLLVVAAPSISLKNVPTIWLLSGGACLSFVAGNNLTLSYAILIFDLVTALYWFRQRQPALSIYRLFLSLLTSMGLILASLDNTSGAIFGGFAMWLRLAFYPFHEITAQTDEADVPFLFYLAMSLTVGLGLVSRTTTSTPEFVRWLAVAMMLLSGSLAWLTEPIENGTLHHTRTRLLGRLVCTQTAFLLLVSPLPATITAIFAVSLILSFTILWEMPGLVSLPNFDSFLKPELWFYFPIVVATLTLPTSLGWVSQPTIYQALLESKNALLIVLAILAEGIALSSLLIYWQMLVHEAKLPLMKGNNSPTFYQHRWPLLAIFLITLFLTPGIAQLLIFIMLEMTVSVLNFNQPVRIFVAMGLPLFAAIGFGYYRPEIIAQLKITPPILTQIARLEWLTQLTHPLDQLGKLILRVWVILEGQHYIGWALFTALAGILAVISRD